jgi:osmotically inducible protein OsmC
VPRIERTADVRWEGNLARGNGLITAGSSSAFASLPYSNATRIGQPDGKTSPEELLAAAHGGCFTMSLAGELSALGHPPERLEVTCRIIMDEVQEQGHQIVGSQVTAAATVPEIDQATFDKAVLLADEGCPFSALLKRSGATVEITSRLKAG